MISSLKRFFGDGYRVFFLAAGLYAVFTVGFWVLWLGVHWAGGMFTSLPFAMPPHLWHGHELVFGYGGAALGGFLLTAVPNWTGAKAARHLFIATAAGLWLMGRIAVWYSGALPAPLVMVADLAFLPLLAAKIATQLVKRPKPQNVMFLGLLSIIWIANLMVHLEWMAVTDDTALQGLRAGIYGLCAMIAVLGGRVTPAFTRNAMVREGVETGLPISRKPLEISGVALAIILPIAVMLRLPDPWVAVLMIVCGLLQIARTAGWRPAFAARQPILWSLHLSFALVGFGLILTGLALLGFGSEVAALHVTAIGGVAGMTLAVMSRATLGHSGRPLVAPRLLAAAYAMLPLAALLRWVASGLSGAWYFPGVVGAGLLWILAFAFYAAALWPAFWGPRVQAKE
jgi:uncharacterized protein involved in response to NO